MTNDEKLQNVMAVTEELTGFRQGEALVKRTKTMAIHENGQRLADGVPLGKKRISGNWRITEYRVVPERGSQSFEQVFRFDKETKPSL
jgi:hypothetical protein